MPNWVTNKLIADAATLERVAEIVKSDESLFDFQKLIPMPEEIRNTNSPARIVSEEQYDGNPKSGITQAMSDALIAKYGTNNWYDWALDHWGTKWGSESVFISTDYIEFDTAWSSPQPIFIALSKLFPDVEFTIQYADEDFGYNVGEYSVIDGELYNDNFPEGGSKEAIQLAMEIRGDEEYYTTEFLYDVDDDEVNDYHLKCVEIAYEMGVELSDEYPAVILEHFKKIAVEREDYKFASTAEHFLKDKLEN